MAEDISIAVSVKDNMTEPIGKMSKKMQEISEKTDALKAKLEALNKKKAELKVDFSKASKEAKAAQKQFNETNDVLDKTKAIAATFNADSIKNELQAWGDEAKKVKKDIAELNSQLNKTQNRANGKQSGGFFDEATSGILKAQAINAAVDFGVNLGNYFIGSAFGSEAANVAGGALSGAASGALAGFTAGGPVGAVIGGGIGLLVGGARGFIQNEQSKDDFFKGIVQDKYSESVQEREEFLKRGSGTAAGREIDEISFSTLIGPEYKDYLAWVTKTGATTPFEYSDLTALSKTLATYGYSAEEMKDLLIKIGDTGSNLGLDASGMSMVATGLGRMKSSDKTTLEYLNLLLERGIPVIDYLSDGLGKSKGEIYDMISKGLIPGAEAATIIADKMGEANSGAMKTMSKTYQGLLSTIEDTQTNLEAAQGEAYNNARKDTLEYQTGWNERNEDKMKKAYEAMGILEAQLQNAQDIALNAEYNKILNSDEYKIVAAIPEGATKLTPEQENAAREVSKAMAAAKANAEKTYMETDGFRKKQETEKNIVAMLQDTVKDDWYNYGKEIQEQLNLGRAAAGFRTSEDNPSIISSNKKDLLDMGVSEEEIRYRNGTYYSVGRKKEAFGMPTVPYDNFPALLHQGEMVLTASQARAYKGQTGGVIVTGNQFTVREEADIDRIAAELARQIAQAREGYIYA